eukprot:g26949.t1
MNQAQQQYGGQKQYMYNASMELKNQGNADIKAGKYAEALKSYSRAIDNLKMFAGEDARPESRNHNVLSKGVSAAEIASALEKVEASSNTPAASSSSAPADLDKKMEQFYSNPDMVTQATEAMKKIRKTLEAVSKNPEMLKSAMDSFKSMPEEERKKMMAAAQAGMNPGSASFDSSQMTDACMQEALKDPAMLKTAMAAAGDGPEADLMKKMTENPEMMDAMTNMMKNIPPEQMQKMMEMSMKMKSSGGDPKDPSEMLNDPEMMKAAEEMMKNISPEALQSMAKSAGVEVSDSHAKMISKVMPYMMKLLKLWGHIKKMFQAMFSARGRIVLAVVIVLVAVGQHYFFSGDKN